ncbi:UDP-3-O-acyl-N-acetylglucosamine deacetylase [Rickettsiales bacterium]|nr:UDP-3-O-acyl-N-acetylglucosamine deacetylase [Rickettsiales bacterium]
MSYKIQQKTINSKIKCSGIGLHSNEKINLNLLPAPENNGITFKRIDSKKRNKIIKASYDNVIATNLGTVISNKDNLTVSTVEHLMAAIWGCDIDNMIIEIDGPEVPIMDGSSEPFSFLIECAGITNQQQERKVIEILKNISFKEDDKFIHVEPANDFTLDLEVDFRKIGRQKFSYIAKSTSFKTDICRARTFCFESDIEQMRKNNMAKGGSLKNAIVLNDKGKIINEEPLRYKDEFVRHKVLDFIGDIYLSGYFIIAKFKAYKPGHTINNKLLRKIFSDNEAYRII